MAAEGADGGEKTICGRPIESTHQGFPICREQSGKMVRDGKEEEEESDQGPSWMKPLLKTSFFIPCHVHGGAAKNECNMYCLGCMGAALCSYCLPDHRDHHVVQVRTLSLEAPLSLSLSARPSISLCINRSIYLSLSPVDKEVVVP